MGERGRLDPRRNEPGAASSEQLRCCVLTRETSWEQVRPQTHPGDPQRYSLTPWTCLYGSFMVSKSLSHDSIH